MKNSIIEINKKKSKAGRLPIKLILHEIYADTNSYNLNGISWNRQYTEDNIESVKSIPLVTQFIDENNAIPLGGHGEMNAVDGDVYFEDSVVVGAFENAYIDDNIEINGKTISALVGEAYIFNQRFPKFTEYLQEQYENGIPIEGSIEINADKSNGNTKIIYDGGYKEKGRIPQLYQYSGHALLFGETPADPSSILLELNSYKNKEGDSQKMKKNIINKGVTIELNKLSFDTIAMLTTKAFNKAMGVSDYCNDYYIYKFYPETNELVFKKWEDCGKYYMAQYKIENSTVSIGDIEKVEEDWKPVSDSQAVEVNINNIKEFITNKGGNERMTIEELNAKIVEMTAQVAELNAKVAELNSANVEKDSKISEIDGLLVEANKTIGEINAKNSALEVECNGYKEEKEKQEVEQKKVEINAYFETEIPKNGFEETEVNSLKEYVEKCDLEGLKQAEKDLVYKRFKEGKLNVVETNAEKKEDIFFSTKEEKLGDIEAGKSLFM